MFATPIPPNSLSITHQSPRKKVNLSHTTSATLNLQDVWRNHPASIPLSNITNNVSNLSNNSIRPHSGALLRISAPVVLPSAAQNIAAHPPRPRYRTTSATAFTRVTTLASSSNAPTSHLGVAPVSLQQQAAAATARSYASVVASSMLTPSKTKALEASLDTTGRQRHQQLPSLRNDFGHEVNASLPQTDRLKAAQTSVNYTVPTTLIADPMSAPAHISNHRYSQSRAESNRFGSARRHRHHHTVSGSMLYRQRTPATSQSAHPTSSLPSSFNPDSLLQGSPMSAFSDMGFSSPPRSTVRQSSASLIASTNPTTAASANVVPILSLPTQPTGVSASVAAAAMLADAPATSRQPTAPTAPLNRVGSGGITSRLSARVQHRRINRSANMMRGHTMSLTEPINPSACFEVGVAEDANVKFRQSMEDAHIVKIGMGLEGFQGAVANGTDQQAEKWKPIVGYVAIYDGHGGRDCVDFVQSHLHQQLSKELLTKPADAQAALKDAFLKTDEAMKNDINFQDCGSTAVSALVRPSVSRQGQRDLFVANVGDARAVLAKSDNSDAVSAIRLTKDHVPRTPGEINRIIRAGGCVFNNRVAGQLAVSRAFGDMALKKNGVSSHPHISKTSLTEEHKFALVACDGLWDVVSDVEAVEAVKDIQSPTDMAQRLVKMALERGTTDNISVMAVRLQKSQ